jgi:hypothetical protein
LRLSGAAPDLRFQPGEEFDSMAVEDTTAFPSFREQITRALALFALLVTCGLVLAGTARAEIEAPPPPQVWSDKADYAPGELVTLSGANWAPGESVHVRVNDDAGQSWSRDVDVTASADGTFTDQFNLPDWFVAVYSVTATGASSGTATWSFTDGNVTVHLDAAEGVSSMTVTYDRWNGTNQNPNPTCSGAPTLVNLTLFVPSGGTANIPGFGGNNDSVRFKSVSTPTAGKAFDRWTSETTRRIPERRSPARPRRASRTVEAAPTATSRTRTATSRTRTRRRFARTAARRRVRTCRSRRTSAVRTPRATRSPTRSSPDPHTAI